MAEHWRAEAERPVTTSGPRSSAAPQARPHCGRTPTAVPPEGRLSLPSALLRMRRRRPCPRFWTQGSGAVRVRADGTSAMAGAGPRRAAMARPTILPLRVRVTVPEAFMVLHLRMKVVEEQTSALVRDLKELGISGQR